MSRLHASLQYASGKHDQHADIPPAKGMNFFYIGKKAEKIGLLTKAFGEGRYCENIRSALSQINQFFTKHAMPGVVVIAGETDELMLKELDQIVTAQVNHAAVPFIMDAGGMTEHNIKRCLYFQFLDDIILLSGGNLDKFVSQVRFLQRMKAPSSLHKRKNVEHTFPPSFNWKTAVRRIIDFAVSLLAVIVLSPLLLLIAAAIKIETSGPVLYISRRAGRGYRVFRFYKFRTMVPDADKKIAQLVHLNQYNRAEAQEPVFYKFADDPRCTRVGRILRATSLDELPQFFNVLLGDMSLVGNRPLPLAEAAALTTDEWAARFMAPAGITGLWQIKNKQSGNMSAKERISLDIDYANKYSLAYDLWIIAQTPVALIRKSNSWIKSTKRVKN